MTKYKIEVVHLDGGREIIWCDTYDWGVIPGVFYWQDAKVKQAISYNSVRSITTKEVLTND